MRLSGEGFAGREVWLGAVEARVLGTAEPPPLPDRVRPVRARAGIVSGDWALSCLWWRGLVSGGALGLRLGGIRLEI